jgi:WD40 repeat protein
LIFSEVSVFYIAKCDIFLFFKAVAVISPHGASVLVGSKDKTAGLWNAESGECLRTWFLAGRPGRM